MPILGGDKVGRGLFAEIVSISKLMENTIVYFWNLGEFGMGSQELYWGGIMSDFINSNAKARSF